MDGGAANPEICAVVFQPSHALDRALAGQERPPAQVLRHHGRLADALRLGVESGADWIWLLDGTVAPKPAALDELVGAMDRARGLPAPVILSGLVVDRLGRVGRAHASWYRRAPTEPVMEAAERRLVPIRAACPPLLVRRTALESEAGPRTGLPARGAVLEWTARLLRAGVGYWVPQSESIALDGTRNPAWHPFTAAALMAGGALGTGDRVRFAAELVEGLASRLSRSGN